MLRGVHLFGIHIPMYSLFVFLGVTAFFTVFIAVVKKEKLERVSLNRLIFFSGLGLLVLYVSAFLFNSLFHSIERNEIVFGGITWLGGVIGIIPFMIFAFHKFVPRASGNAVAYFSLLVPGIVLGHALGRLGCFFGGCCYGKVTDGIFGVVFPEGSPAAIAYPAADGRSQSVYPTQLFEAVFEFVLFVILMASRKKTGRYQTEIYMIAYGVFRFFLEFLRGDDRGSTGFFLSPAQFFCVLLVLAGVFMFLYEKGITFETLKKKRVFWSEEAKKKVDALAKEQEKTQSVTILKELYELKEKGVITEAEFAEKKEKILKEI